MRSLPLPQSVKIGLYRFAITERSEEWSNATGVFGMISFSSLEIDVVTEGLNLAIVVDTLMHEVMHGIFYVYAITTLDEEDIVKPMSTGLIAVLADNPDMSRYLTKAALRMHGERHC